MYFNKISYYKTDWEKIRNQIKSSDLIISDGSHRIAGIKILKDKIHSAEVTYIGIRIDIPFVKQVAFENGKKIITDSNYSLKLVREHIVGDTVFYNRQRPCLEHQIKRCAAPCCLEVDRSDYRRWVKEAMAILDY